MLDFHDRLVIKPYDLSEIKNTLNNDNSDSGLSLGDLNTIEKTFLRCMNIFFMKLQKNDDNDAYAWLAGLKNYLEIDDGDDLLEDDVGDPLFYDLPSNADCLLNELYVLSCYSLCKINYKAKIEQLEQNKIDCVFTQCADLKTDTELYQTIKRQQLYIKLKEQYPKLFSSINEFYQTKYNDILIDREIIEDVTTNEKYAGFLSKSKANSDDNLNPFLGSSKVKQLSNSNENHDDICSPQYAGVGDNDNQIVVDKMISLDPHSGKVTHFYRKNDTKCKVFWFITASILIISGTIYFGFIKNSTKLSYSLGATGIALTFIVTIIGLWLLCKNDPTSHKESINEEEYNHHDGRVIDATVDFEITTDLKKLETANDSKNQPTRSWHK